jgi:hypothetical protein
MPWRINIERCEPVIVFPFWPFPPSPLPCEQAGIAAFPSPRDRIMASEDDRFDDRMDDRNDMPRDDDEIIRRAMAQVKAPAIGLIVTAIISLIFIPIGVANYVFLMPAQMEQARKDIENNAQMPAEQKKQTLEFMNMYENALKVASPISWVLIAGTGILTLMAGMKLKNLTSPGMVKFGSIMSFIPCISGCCLLGLVFGIWALVVMGNSEVKAGFAAMRRRSAF